ncbi:SCO family protein, partial [Natronobacterium gregoryi]
TVGVAGLAGCLEESLGAVGLGDGGETVLGPPDEERGEPSHPIHGDEFPPFSLPDPITDEPVSRRDFVGERTFLMTYLFTECPDGACPALLQIFRQIQEDAAQRGYSDELALLPMTFDPERDTAERLAEYGDRQGVDYEADNWHFLRPESYEEGKALLHDEFGMRIERVEGDDLEEHGDHEDHDHGHDDYSFTHINLVLLVNEAGIVERAYPRALVAEAGGGVRTILADTQAVVTAQNDHLDVDDERQ